jgi:hypothetical protein
MTIARLSLGMSKSANSNPHEFMRGTDQQDSQGQLQATFSLEQMANEK